MPKASDKKTNVIGVRVDDDMQKWLAVLARENGNTVSGQAEHLLQIARLVLDRTEGDARLTVIRETLADYAKGRNSQVRTNGKEQ